MFKRWAGRPFRPLFSSLVAQLPSQCTVCRAWPSTPICDDCVARFAAPEPRCRRCALPLVPGNPECRACMSDPPALDACAVACAYVWPWAPSIAAFKFEGDAGRAAPLAALLASAPWVEPELEQADLVLPMPLARGRLRERGFNQAHELARRLEPAKCDPTLLLRVRETPPQSSLERRDRLRNLEGAFALDPQREGAVRGRRVVLVDDVMTSGASLSMAARVLRAGGAARVSAVVLARTDAPG